MVFSWGSVSAMFRKTLATFGLPSLMKLFESGQHGAMPGSLGHAREGIWAGLSELLGGV
jgi:hypothetical protein